MKVGAASRRGYSFTGVQQRSLLFTSVAGSRIWLLLLLFPLSACFGRNDNTVEPISEITQSVVSPIREIGVRQTTPTMLQLHRGIPFVKVSTTFGPMHLILDTGSDQFMVAEKFVTRVGLPLTPVSERLTDTSGRELQLNQAVKIDGLKIGSQRFDTIDARVMSLVQLETRIGREIDGILGLRLFDDHIIDIDLSNGRLQLFDHDGRMLSGGYAYYSHRGRVVVDLKIGRNIVPALVDTGDNGHIGIDRSFSSQLDLVDGITDTIRLNGVVGMSSAEEVRIRNEIWLGPWQLPDGPIRFASYPSPGVVAARIGTAVLTKYRITIDPKNELIRFVPI